MAKVAGNYPDKAEPEAGQGGGLPILGRRSRPAR